MPGRFEFERAIRRSGLPPLARLLALTLATWAHHESGIIPPAHQPAQSVLMEATGLSKSAFLNHRATLVQEGWVSYTSPSRELARREHAQCRYSIHVPAGSGADLAHAEAGSPDDLAKTDSRGNSSRTEAGSGADLGRVATVARSADDPAEGGEIGTTSPRSAPDLGRQATTRVPKRSRSTTSLAVEGFEDFWREYPRKASKSDALKAFAGVVQAGVSPEHLATAAKRHREHWQAEGRQPGYIPYPATWLRKGSYDDELHTPQQPPAPQQRGLWADPTERGIF